MTFKTNLAAASCTALGGFSLLQVQGPGAAAFLQAQSMNDVAALAVGQWHWNGLLTAKGRVLALFALVRDAEDRFLLVLPDFPARELLPVLQRYVFRSKLTLQAVEDRVAASGPVGEVLAQGQWVGSAAHGVSLDLGAGPGRRSLWLLPAGHPALAASQPTTDAAWAAADLGLGFPRLPLGQRETWTPQMLSLERFAAFSLGKGCYPGQEIVARTHYLGAAKRTLCRLRCARLLEPGDTVSEATGRTVGTIVCRVELGDGCEALAVLLIDAVGRPLHAQAAPVDLLPFNPVGGLATADPG